MRLLFLLILVGAQALAAEIATRDTVSISTIATIDGVAKTSLSTVDGLTVPSGGGGGGSPPTYINGSVTDFSSTASPTLNNPSSPTANDIWLLTITTDSAHDTSGTPPGDWEELHQINITDGDSSSTTFWKRASGSEGATEAWPNIFAASEVGKAIIVVYRGCKTSGSPFNTSATDQSPSSEGQPKAVGPATTTVNNCIAVVIFASDPGSSTTRSFTFDVGLDSRVNLGTTPNGSGNANGYIFIADKVIATAGGTGSLGGSLDASDTSAEFLYALEPQ